ncbi:MAG: glycosyltransferase family 4 protein [Chitinispirillaceae bacterium]
MADTLINGHRTIREMDVFYNRHMTIENKEHNPGVTAFMNSIPADVWRGGEKWMVNAAAGLAGRGHKVICIGRKHAVWLEKAMARGIETIGLPIHSDFDPIIICRLFSLFKKRHVRILCCNFEKDVRLGGIAGRMAGLEKIFVRKGLSLIYDKLRYRLAYKYVVDDIITPAAFIKKQFAAFPWLDQNRIHVVPNGVEVPDAARFDIRKLRIRAGITGNDPVVFGAGRIFSQKGFEYFIEALSLLHRQGIRVHGAIAGGGDEETITALAGQFGIASFVHLLGHCNDVLELMYGADAFILSSVDEGLPNVVLEAMSVGTPVVAAGAGGTAEIITDGADGFVVPVKDSGSLADRIGRLIKEKALAARIGSAGKKTVQERFSLPRMVDKLEALFLLSVSDTEGGGAHDKR